MDQPPSLPKRIAWFAPWTWKRRWWAGVVLLMLLLGYLELPVVYGIFLEHVPFDVAVASSNVVTWLEAPHWWCREQFPIVDGFYGAQDDFLRHVGVLKPIAPVHY